MFLDFGTAVAGCALQMNLLTKLVLHSGFVRRLQWLQHNEHNGVIGDFSALMQDKVLGKPDALSIFCMYAAPYS